MLKAGRVHAGVVLVSAKRFSNSRAKLPRLVHALHHLAESGRRLEGHVTWLR